MKTLIVGGENGPEEPDMTPEAILDLQGAQASFPDTAALSDPTLTRRQLRLWLAVTKGIPLANVDAAIAQLQEPDRSIAAIEWAESASYARSHPLINVVGMTLGLTPEEIDAGFAEAPGLWP